MMTMRRAVAGIALAACCFSGCAADLPHVEAPAVTVDRATTTAQTEVITTTTNGIPAAVLEAVQPTPADTDFVRICDYIPDIVVDLRYATADNFTGQVIYDFNDAWLRYGTVKKLMTAQETLEPQGARLKIWDAFRPSAAQFTLWEVCPNPTYVANPNGGFSSHSRGNTVDVTLVYADGTECVMPTGFDDFSTLANRDYSDCSEQAASNTRMLEQAMQAAGFSPYYGEWWHFSDTVSYAAEETFTPKPPQTCAVAYDQSVSLYTAPDSDAAALATIGADETCRVIATYGAYSLVEYYHLRGYVLSEYL